MRKSQNKMSGIAGIFCCQTDIKNKSYLENMIEAIRHRGIDGIGRYYNDNVAFANFKFNTTYDSFYENQPLAEENYIITADARIDNRDELIEKLNLSSSTNISNSEIILAAYKNWGDDCLFHLIGDFAFAIWDNIKQQLFCGRDHMGLRPFYYYYEEGKVFAFASEIKALLALDFVPKTVCKEKVAVYLSLLPDNRAAKSNTFYENILSLRPAFRLNVSSKSIEQQFCWDFNLSRFSHLKTEEDFIQTFKALFIEAVKCRINTPFGLASHLSGGLDSSSVSSVASEIYPNSIEAFHFDFNLKSSDEKEFALAVVKQHPKIKLNYIDTDKSILDSSRTISDISDSPDLAVLSSLPYLKMAQLIQNKNCKICITGHNGDTVVRFGTGYLDELKQEEQTVIFKQAARMYADKRQVIRNNKEWSLEKKIEKVCLNYYINDIKKSIIFFEIIKTIELVLSYIKVGGSIYILLASLVERTINKFQKTKNSHKKIITDLLNIQNLDALIKKNLQHDVIPNIPENLHQFFYDIYNGPHIEFNEQQNHLGVLHQYTVAHPFFDKRLIELCLVIPDKVNFNNGYLRGAIREGMKEYLPEKVRLRTTKADFTEYLDKLLVDINEHNLQAYNDSQVIAKIFKLKSKQQFIFARFIFIIHWLKQRKK